MSIYFSVWLTSKGGASACAARHLEAPRKQPARQTEHDIRVVMMESRKQNQSETIVLDFIHHHKSFLIYLEAKQPRFIFIDIPLLPFLPCCQDSFEQCVKERRRPTSLEHLQNRNSDLHQKPSQCDCKDGNILNLKKRCVPVKPMKAAQRVSDAAN